MSRTKQEIIDYHTQSHDELTRVYYSNPQDFPGGKAAFDFNHGVIWSALEHELIEAGYMQPPGPTLEERIKALEDKVG